MQFGYISFCNSTAFNIKSEHVKKDILNKIETLSGIKIIQKHFTNFNESHFKKLNDIPHLVSLKSNGNPYLLFLTKINYTNISIFIDKKIQPGYFLPRMIVSYFQFDDTLYDNTLLDGEMVKIKDNKWKFIINDIYINKNKNLINQNIINRLEIINVILNFKINYNDYDICNITVNKYFKYDQMKYMVEEYKFKKDCEKYGRQAALICKENLKAVKSDKIKKSILDMLGFHNNGEEMLFLDKKQMFISLFDKDFKRFIELLNDNNTTIDVDTKKQSLSFDFINNKKTVLEVNIPFTFNKNGTWFLDKKYKNTDNKFYHEKEGIYLSYGDRRPKKSSEFATSTNTWINFHKVLTQVRSKKL